MMPALANSGDLVVEVHMGISGVAGPLWCRTARWEAAGLQWGNSFKFEDTGFGPAVSVALTRVVEVHVDRDGYGQLWFRTGDIGANGQITWSNSSQFGNGRNPAVALAPDGSAAVSVCEDGQGGMLFNWGPWQSESIQWGPQQRYDTGLNPSIVIAAPYGQNSDPVIIEVHQAKKDTGPLWYRTGLLSPSTGVTWDKSHQYDNGATPAVAVTHDGSQGVEVHAAFFGIDPYPLWSRVFKVL
jgi:hypothetical protein